MAKTQTNLTKPQTKKTQKTARTTKKSDTPQPPKIAQATKQPPAPPIKPVLRKARLTDADAIKSLVLLYAKKQQMLPRSLNEIYENIRDYSVIEHNGIIIACGGLHVCWVDLAEIKALAVAPSYIGIGLGRKMVDFLTKEAKSLGIPRLFCLTYKKDFFARCGFSVVDVNDLPKKVWVECVRCIHFPNCSEIAMTKDL